MDRPQKQQKTRSPPDILKRRNHTTAVGLDAAQLGRTAFERAGFTDPTLVLRWSEIVGPDLARFTQPLRLTGGSSGGVLTLKADPAASVFLQHESRALCSRINAFLGMSAVQRLRFVPGNAMPKLRTPQEATTRDLAPEDPARRFAGREKLRAALLALANARVRNSPSPKD